jgi:hypothetical protein
LTNILGEAHLAPAKKLRFDRVLAARATSASVKYLANIGQWRGEVSENRGTRFDTSSLNAMSGQPQQALAHPSERLVPGQLFAVNDGVLGLFTGLVISTTRRCQRIC